MNIKIWIFVAIIIAVLIIGYMVGKRSKNAMLPCVGCGGANSTAGAVNNATGAGAGVTANAALVKTGINQAESAKG